MTATPPENAEEIAVGYMLKPFQERTLRAALREVEKKLAGERIKKVDGLVLYDGTSRPS